MKRNITKSKQPASSADIQCVENQTLIDTPTLPSAIEHSAAPKAPDERPLGDGNGRTVVMGLRTTLKPIKRLNFVKVRNLAAELRPHGALITYNETTSSNFFRPIKELKIPHLKRRHSNRYHVLNLVFNQNGAILICDHLSDSKISI